MHCAYSSFFLSLDNSLSPNKKKKKTPYVWDWLPSQFDFLIYILSGSLIYCLRFAFFSFSSVDLLHLVVLVNFFFYTHTLVLLQTVIVWHRKENSLFFCFQFCTFLNIHNWSWLGLLKRLYMNVVFKGV